MNAAIESRKKTEIEHYDAKAREWMDLRSEEKWGTDVHGISHGRFSSYRFFEEWLQEHCRGRKLLDYGCGTGIHSILPARLGAEVIGIDLSEESLKIARERARRAGVEDRVSFMAMDCEQLDFADGSFDLVLDGGTFSSIDIRKAFPELARVLRPGGLLIGIETLGHNPLANFKRRINAWLGIRTSWAQRHILRMEHFEEARKHFASVEVRYFHLVSLLALPLARFSAARPLLRAAERIDRGLLKRPSLQKYAFKSVFVFTAPFQRPCQSAAQMAAAERCVPERGSA